MPHVEPALAGAPQERPENGDQSAHGGEVWNDREIHTRAGNPPLYGLYTGAPCPWAMADKPPPRRGAVIGCLRITMLSDRVVPRRQAGRTRWKQCDSRPVFPRYGKTEAGPAAAAAGCVSARPMWRRCGCL